jgi:sporulation protein YlmC with PRC-barrel domain
MQQNKDNVTRKRNTTDETVYTGTTTGYTETTPGTGRTDDLRSSAREKYESAKETVREKFGEERVHNQRVLAASTLTGDRVRNNAGEDLGKIEEIMLDIHSGRIAYAVLSFGGFLGMGNKLFAVPWHSLRVDLENHEFVLDVSRETLENAPGFDKDDWPDMADPDWGAQIHRHYGRSPYWEQDEGLNFDQETQGTRVTNTPRDRGDAL